MANISKEERAKRELEKENTKPVVDVKKDTPKLPYWKTRNSK